MPTRIRLSAAFVAGVFILGATVAATTEKEAHEFTISVETCFRNSLEKHNRSARTKVPLDASTAVFIAEQVVTLFESDKDNSSKRPTIREVEPVCQQLASLYIRQATIAVERERTQNADAMARLGSAPVTSSSDVVSTYQRLIGRHYRGHYDISKDAASGNDTLSSAAVELIARASQGPDLYRWKDERYHAHTPQYESADGKITMQSDGMRRFVQLVANLITQANNRAEQGDTESALVLIGFAAHMVQDLVYHRGMTLQQHAGLSYHLKRDPDSPDEPLRSQRYSEAVEKTRWLLDVGLRTMGQPAKQRIKNWSPSGSFEPGKAIQTAFGLQGGADVEDISSNELVKYWLLARPYWEGSRSIDDLQQTPCNSKQGLACWEIDGVRTQIAEVIRKR